jgi:hypothetical protein
MGFLRGVRQLGIKNGGVSGKVPLEEPDRWIEVFEGCTP